MKPIEIPPGVKPTATMAKYSSNWREANLIRWSKDRLKPIGGWKQVSYDTVVASRIRRIHTWLDNDGIKFTAYLCEANIYVDIAGELFDITPIGGMEAPSSDVAAGGYGESTFSFGSYGTARPDREVSRSIGPAYSIDNWGENLLVMTSVDGRLLEWAPDGGGASPAEVVANSPSGRCFVVTPERSIIIFGSAGIPQNYAWCDQEDNTDWTAGVANTAGDGAVEPAAIIVAAKMTSDGPVFFTPVSSYLVEYIGAPFYYRHTKMRDAVTPMSPGSVASGNTDAMWPSESGFWEYTAGSVRNVDCPLWDWITKDIDPLYSRYEAFGVNIASMGEYWWFFPALGERYNTKFVMYNYIDGWWSMGKLTRSAGISSAYDTYPILTDDTDIYSHENGMEYPGALPEYPWIESHVINADSGSFKGTITQMLPEADGDIDQLRFRLKYKTDRSRSEVVVCPQKEIRSNGYVDFRCTGRDFQFRIDATTDEVDWTLGQHQIELKKRGKR